MGSMRITSQSLVNRTQLSLRNATAKLAEAQEQVTTGKRLLRPSDDPSDAAVVAANRTADLRFDAHLATIQDSSGILEQSVTAFLEMRDLLTRANEVALEANSDGTPDSTDGTFAIEVDAMIQEALNIVNRKLADGRSLFAGTATDTTAFSVQATNGTGLPQLVRYDGATKDVESLVGPSQTVATMISGERAFQGRGRGATTFIGETGASVGTGTNSATGSGVLQVRHTTTGYSAATSGIAAGASTGSDTIIGGYQLAIVDNGGSTNTGTIQLVGPSGSGAVVSYSAGQTDVLVTGRNGELVYVNTSAISDGFNGTDNITGNGTLSTDGGLTTTAINFTANQAVTDSRTGGTTFVNSTGITQTGDEVLDHADSYDIFETLITLRDTLRNENGLSAADVHTMLTATIREFERLHESLGLSMGDQAASAENLTAVRSRTEGLQLQLQEMNIELESIDLSEAVVNLQQQETLFQSSLAIAARTNSLSLLDFLR